MEISGAEINVGGANNSSTLRRLGWSCVAFGSIRGSSLDAAFSVGSFNYTAARTLVIRKGSSGTRRGGMASRSRPATAEARSLLLVP